MSRRSVILTLLILLLVSVVVLGLVFGLGGQAAAPYILQSGGAPIVPTNAAVSASYATAKNGGDESDQSVAYKAADQPQRLVIKDATLRLVVSNPQEALNGIVKMTDDMGGWVVNSSTYQTHNASGASVTQAQAVIRVPAERLTEAMDRIKAGAVSVEQENITGSDVTRQYTDLNSQLTNLQAAEEQLRKIMEAAQKTDDVLAVYQQLTQVRGQIEVAKGQMQYYKEAAAFSSITLTLEASGQDKPVQIGDWRPLDTARSALGALVNLLQMLVNVLIWLIVVILPFVIIFGLPAWIVARFVRRRQARIDVLKVTGSTEL